MFNHIADYYERRMYQFEWKYYIRHYCIKHLTQIMMDMGQLRGDAQ